MNDRQKLQRLFGGIVWLMGVAPAILGGCDNVSTKTQLQSLDVLGTVDSDGLNAGDLGADLHRGDGTAMDAALDGFVKPDGVLDQSDLSTDPCAGRPVCDMLEMHRCVDATSYQVCSLDAEQCRVWGAPVVCPADQSCGVDGFCSSLPDCGCEQRDCGPAPNAAVCPDVECGVCLGCSGEPAGDMCIDGVCMMACCPSCEGNQCGDDGCGGVCGICELGSTCVMGQCQSCQPDCSTRECGPDPNCGQSCGSCEPGLTCTAEGVCSGCVPDCSQRECGPDPVCHQSCGSCPLEQSCNDGQCEACAPDCLDLQCGPDPVCGASCGLCPVGYTCMDNLCICAPNCGDHDCGGDGCGGSCGLCGVGERCVEGHCQLCQTNCSGLQCGPDGCGGQCGACPPDESCVDGQCYGQATCSEIYGCMASCMVAGGLWADCVADCLLGASPQAAAQAAVVRACVEQECGNAPQLDCVLAATAGACADELQVCLSGCSPDCLGLQCGDDGCGGSCGTCASGTLCNNGHCQLCTPQCTGAECGDNGCGGTCPPGCAAGEGCVLGQCVACTPQCSGRVCGDNGCGGSCGLCSEGQACEDGQCYAYATCADALNCVIQCIADGGEFQDCAGTCSQGLSPAAAAGLQPLLFCVLIECAGDLGQDCLLTAVSSGGPCAEDAQQCMAPCTPQCFDRHCGPDQCGGLCGLCPPDEACVDGQCELCFPQCGSHDCDDDGCGGTCGSCPAGYSCVAGYCTAGCDPQCDGRSCGDDGCGSSCGSCPSGATCEDGRCFAYTTCGAVLSCLMDCLLDQADYLSCLSDCGAQASPTALEQLTPVTACLIQACGTNPDPTCALDAVMGGVCQAVFNNCMNGCAPDCRGRFCGDDGCGGSCGTCGPLESCTQWGQCAPCMPQCAGRECGDNACGGQCGSCAPGTACEDGQCQGCTPQCQNRQCGDDGCNGQCAPGCAGDETCETGHCYLYTTCGQVLNCLTTCVLDGQSPLDCLSACQQDASPTARNAINPLVMCVAGHCFADQSAACLLGAIAPGGACADQAADCFAN